MMDGPSILINDPPPGPKKPAQDFELGWSLLLALGWLFVVIGLLNLVLIWLPLQMGNPEYEFGSVANSLDSLPLPTMGLVWALAASRAQGRSRGAMLATILLCGLATLALAAGVLYWLNVPIALKAVQEPLIRLGIKKSIFKVTTQAVLYPLAMVALALMGMRSRSTKA
jgi:hypothetical protein